MPDRMLPHHGEWDAVQLVHRKKQWDDIASSRRLQRLEERLDRLDMLRCKPSEILEELHHGDSSQRPVRASFGGNQAFSDLGEPAAVGNAHLDEPPFALPFARLEARRQYLSRWLQG